MLKLMCKLAVCCGQPVCGQAADFDPGLKKKLKTKVLWRSNTNPYFIELITWILKLSLSPRDQDIYLFVFTCTVLEITILNVDLTSPKKKVKIFGTEVDSHLT